MIVNNNIYFLIVPEFGGVSEQARDLICKMICPVKERYTAEQVLYHNWLKSDLSSSKHKLKLNFEHLKMFTQHQKLKKVALTFIASQLSENEITELGKLFRQLDANSDGVLTMDEIQNGLNNI